MKRLNPVCGLITAIIITCSALLTTACGNEGDGNAAHIHEYSVVAAKSATCEADGNVEYYKCFCGDVAVKTDGVWAKKTLSDVTIAGGHKYSAEIGEIESTCDKNGVKAHYECERCGGLFVKEGNEYKKVNAENLATAKRNHVFDQKKIADKYLVSEATETAAQTFVYSCVCGAKIDGADAHTFTVGKTLAEYETADENLYEPSSFTLSLYDAENCVYGFTWAVKTLPARPIVKIGKGNSFGGDYTEVRADCAEASSYE